MYSDHGTVGEPSAVAGVSGCWRVEGGLQGAQSPLSCLGVAYASRHKGCMNGLCLASICGFLLSTYEYLRVVGDCRYYSSGAYFFGRAENHRGRYPVVVSKESFYPDRIGGEVVARGAAGVRG